MRSLLYIVPILFLAGVFAENFTCLKNENQEKQVCNEIVKECFVLYNKKSGEREYGCVSSMNDDQQNVCTNQKDFCVTCNSEDCNTKDKLKLCMSCNGEPCTVNPEKIKKSSLVRCDTDCYTSFNKEDGLNERGCLRQDMDCDDPSTCKICKDDMCNTEIFPEDRRVCIDKKEGFVGCTNVTDTCLTILKPDGNPILLGCTQELLKNPKFSKTCNEKPYLCLECLENRCNENEKRKKCIKCDQSNENCLKNPEQIPEGNNIEFCKDDCYIEVGKGVVKRGCSDNYKCVGNKCVTCVEKFCTNLPQLSCWRNRNETVDCQSPDDKCVNVYDFTTGLPKAQGCFDDLDKNLKNICTKDPRKCALCEGKNCNVWKEAFLCYTCNGLDCLKPKDDHKTICDKSVCYTELNDDKTNKRGCGDCEGKSCSSCEGNSCNKDVFPQNRRQCLINDKNESEYCQDISGDCYANVLSTGVVTRGCYKKNSVCDEGTCQKCGSNKCNSWKTCLECKDTESCSKPSYCFNTNELPSCFSRIVDGEIEKGCNAKNYCNGQTYCVECSEPNCNKKNPEITGRQCFKCTGKKDCADKQTNKLVACNDPEDMCYIMIDGEQVERGCLKSHQKASCEMPNCSVCSGERGCNGYALKSAQCYECSDNDIGCGPNIDDDLLQPKDCPGFLFPEQHECFLMKNETRRGCLSPSEVPTCDNSVKSCCTGKACNKEAIRNNTLYKRCGWTTWILSFITVLISFNISS